MGLPSQERFRRSDRASYEGCETGPEGTSGPLRRWRTWQPRTYQIQKRAGEFRNTTLRDIKKNGWLPSVSSILSIQAKPGLDNWKKEHVAKAAWELAHNHDDWELQQWLDNVSDLAESKMSKARDLGTEIHGAIERFLKNPKWMPGYDFVTPDPDDHPDHVMAAVNALIEFGAWGQPFRAERSFASPLGYGGCLDFFTDTHIADFKCVDSLEKKLDYPERCAQLAAYSMGVHKKMVRCANVFISTSEPGQYLLREWTMEELEWGWNLFMACKHLWEVSNRYIPALSQPQ